MTEHKSLLDFECCIISEIKPHLVEPWIEQQLGPRWNAFDNRQGRWAAFWAGTDLPNCYRYYFSKETDAVMFSLRYPR